MTWRQSTPMGWCCRKSILNSEGVELVMTDKKNRGARMSGRHASDQSPNFHVGFPLLHITFLPSFIRIS